MKATVFSKAVVMMAVVMASVMNFSASATTPADYVKRGDDRRTDDRQDYLPQ